jgi:hypothetical protein
VTLPFDANQLQAGETLRPLESLRFQSGKRVEVGVVFTSNGRASLRIVVEDTNGRAFALRIPAVLVLQLRRACERFLEIVSAPRPKGANGIVRVAEETVPQFTRMPRHGRTAP